MAMYINIIAPFIQSLWALEAAHANASDVFIFWLTIGATLKDLFSRGEDKMGIPSSLRQYVMTVYNSRWKQFFINDVYFTAFALDPRINYLLVTVVTNTNWKTLHRISALGFCYEASHCTTHPSNSILECLKYPDSNVDSQSHHSAPSCL